MATERRRRARDHPWISGFKRLDSSNWLDVDPVNLHFVQESPIVGLESMDEQDWARTFLVVALGPQVPEKIHDLFDVARGAMLYGWFYYPLFHLGEQQLYRVLEAAARERYRQLGGTRSGARYQQVIEALVDAGAIHADDLERWDAGRQLRNRASHLDVQAVMPPGQALRTLRAIAHDISRLFTRGQRIASSTPSS